MDEYIVETRNLKTYFKTPMGNLHAVDNINLKIKKGRTIGIVGESGCGKSTLGRTILRLVKATGGEVLYNRENILDYSKKQLHEMRKNMQIIFQDPYASLNPRMTVSQLIAEPILVNKTIKNKEQIYEKVFELMKTVGLAERYVNTYPHMLDGGRRQRIGIAKALALDPEFIVCDEPVSALDVSIQAQVLNLLMDLQESKRLTYMFITHNLSVVKHISNDIAVMYLGNFVEMTESDKLFENPLHPYTNALLGAIPRPSLKPEHKLTDVIAGEVSNPIEPVPGCRFANRCPYKKPDCTGQHIPFFEPEPGHYVACILFK